MKNFGRVVSLALASQGLFGFHEPMAQDHTFWSEIALLLDVVGKNMEHGGVKLGFIRVTFPETNSQST